MIYGVYTRRRIKNETFHTTQWAIRKTFHFTFVHIFANYRLIFKILSLAHFADNLQ